MEHLLRTQPHLTYYNYANISDRLLEETDNDLFVVYNKYRDKYEVHSIKKFYDSPHAKSIVGTYLEQKHLCGWLTTDVKARDLRRFGKEIAHEEEYMDIIMDNHEKEMDGLFITTGVNEVKKMLGGL